MYKHKKRPPNGGFFIYHLHFDIYWVNWFMKIVVKEMKMKNTLPEYLIYVRLADGTNIQAFIEIGDDDKKQRVNDLILEFFMNDGNLHNNIRKEDVVEEIYLKK